jgi:hypothetical protein
VTVRLLPTSWRNRLGLAGALLAALLVGRGVYWYVAVYRPRESHFHWKPPAGGPSRSAAWARIG